MNVFTFSYAINYKQVMFCINKFKWKVMKCKKTVHLILFVAIMFKLVNILVSIDITSVNYIQMK